MHRLLFVVPAVAAIAIGVFGCQGNTTTIEIRYPDGSTQKVKVSDRSCQMVGWQNRVGLTFSFDILKKYQGEGGFNFDASRIRQLDDLQTDFGLQFEGLCKDYINGFYKGREALYDCRRSNVGNALTALRELKLTLEPVKDIQDAAAKKETVEAALTKYYAVSANNFSKDCNPHALNIDPNELRFNSAVNQQTADVSNGGFFDMTWQTFNTPHNFLCQPSTDTVHPSKSDKLIVYRLHGKVDATAQKLTVHDNFNETAEVRIVVEDSNDESTAKLIGDIKKQLSSTPNVNATTATVAVVKKNYSLAPVGVVNWITGELLGRMGNLGAAKLMLRKAGEDPALKDLPQYKLDLGSVLYKSGDRAEGKRLLGELSRSKDQFYLAQAEKVAQDPGLFGPSGVNVSGSIAVAGQVAAEHRRYSDDTKGVKVGVEGKQAASAPKQSNQ